MKIYKHNHINKIMMGLYFCYLWDYYFSNNNKEEVEDNWIGEDNFRMLRRISILMGREDAAI